jgi:hypothetical protein
LLAVNVHMLYPVSGFRRKRSITLKQKKTLNQNKLITSSILSCFEFYEIKKTKLKQEFLFFFRQN